MEKRSSGKRVVVIATVLLLMGAPQAQAHCDTMDGPVAKAAAKALETGNPNFVLIWVQKRHEAEIKEALKRALPVRKLTGESKELADKYFTETCVRLHRDGEGEPYTGLRPAGTDVGPIIPAADKAIATGSLEGVGKLVIDKTRDGLALRFREVMDKKNFRPDDIAAGREYVKAYVTFLHYSEGVYEKASGESEEHR